ncbi:MAG TPA: hypothetical protein VKW76_00035 [Candidatus Binatia bacterium]|nr:hypothetical protein [Candidatus Binatia bacterium]
MGRLVGIVVVVLALGLLGERADASCVCGDLEGCGSALTCVNSRPGLDCSPPAGGVCALVKGLPNATTCCCGCQKRHGGVALCVDKYAGLADELDGLFAAAAAAVAPAAPRALPLACVPTGDVAKAVDKAVAQGEKKIVQAEKACQQGNKGAEQAAANASGQAVDKLKKKIDKLKKKGVIDAQCAEQYKALADQYLTDAKATPKASTTTTTTTPGGSTTTTTAGRALTVDTAFATASGGQLTDGQVLCLSQITGGCVAAPGACPMVHLHSAAGPSGTITVTVGTMTKGPYTDPESTGMHCGYGAVGPGSGCGTDSLPACP